jgi:two-component system, OmpR family, response regulator QseB
MRVLIVEDDDLLLDGLVVGMKMHGFVADAVTTLADAEAALAADGFEALVLDLMLPDGWGLDLLERLRAQGSRLPVLVLTARDRTGERVAGLDAGADDYLGKPFDLAELAARLRALRRRSQGRAAPELSWNGLVLDPARMTGRLEGREIGFSRRELALLEALLERPGAILPKPALEERLYGWGEEVESNAVEVLVHRLRAKLAPGFIETVRGIGYRIGASA